MSQHSVPPPCVTHPPPLPEVLRPWILPLLLSVHPHLYFPPPPWVLPPHVDAKGQKRPSRFHPLPICLVSFEKLSNVQLTQSITKKEPSCIYTSNGFPVLVGRLQGFPESKVSVTLSCDCMWNETSRMGRGTIPHKNSIASEINLYKLYHEELVFLKLQSRGPACAAGVASSRVAESLWRWKKGTHCIDFYCNSIKC